MNEKIKFTSALHNVSRRIITNRNTVGEPVATRTEAGEGGVDGGVVVPAGRSIQVQVHGEIHINAPCMCWEFKTEN
jgi:hypothetical protein